MVSAAAVVLAAILDPRTGLWFPPGAPADVYLYNRDPQHVYGVDVTNALKDNPKLREEVCSEVAAWTPPFNDAPDGAVRQKRAILAMACAGLGYQHKERAASDVRLDEAKRKLEAALAASSRKRDVESLYDDTRHLYEFDKQAWPNAIDAMAAAPDDVRAIALALRFLFGAGWVQRREEVDELLLRLYAERAASSRPDHDVWQRGYEQLLFMTGKSTEAATFATGISSPARRCCICATERVRRCARSSKRTPRQRSRRWRRARPSRSSNSIPRRRGRRSSACWRCRTRRCRIASTRSWV